MSTSLSNLVDNLSNKVLDDRICDSCGSKLEYIKVRNSDRLIFECFDYKRRYSKKFSEKLKKKKK